MSLTRHFVPLGYVDQEEPMTGPNALLTIRDKQQSMEEQIKLLHDKLASVSSDFAYLRDFCETEIRSMIRQQEVFQGHADDLRKGLKELRKAREKDTARLSSLETALNSWRQACTGSKEALKKIVSGAQDVLNRRRKEFEKETGTFPMIEQRLNSQIIKLQTTVAVLESKLNLMEPRVANREEVNDADREINDRLSELEEDVSQLRGAVQDALLELVERHVPPSKANGVDQSVSLGSSSDGGNGQPQEIGLTLDQELEAASASDKISVKSDALSSFSGSAVVLQSSSDDLTSLSNDSASQAVYTFPPPGKEDGAAAHSVPSGDRVNEATPFGGTMSRVGEKQDGQPQETGLTLNQELETASASDKISVKSDALSSFSGSAVVLQSSSDDLTSLSNDSASQAVYTFPPPGKEEGAAPAHSVPSGDIVNEANLAGETISGRSALNASRETFAHIGAELPYNGGVTTPTFTDALNLLLVVLKARIAVVKSRLEQNLTVEVCKYALAWAIFLLIYLLDEYLFICFSDRPVAMRLRRGSWGSRQPMDSLIIDFLLVLLPLVLAEPV